MITEGCAELPDPCGVSDFLACFVLVALAVDIVGKKKSEPILRVCFTLAQREQTGRAARGQCEHPPSLCAITLPRSARGAGSLCARCRFALRKVQVHSTQGTRSLWARCRVALREVQGRPGRGEGLRCARVRVALGEVQGRFWRGAGSLCASRHL